MWSGVQQPGDWPSRAPDPVERVSLVMSSEGCLTSRLARKCGWVSSSLFKWILSVAGILVSIVFLRDVKRLQRDKPRLLSWEGRVEKWSYNLAPTHSRLPAENTVAKRSKGVEEDHDTPRETKAKEVPA